VAPPADELRAMHPERATRAAALPSILPDWTREMLAYEYKLKTQYSAAGDDRSIPAISTFAIPSRSAKIHCRDFSATIPRLPGFLAISLILI
jgi:hypothetical protein